MHKRKIPVSQVFCFPLVMLIAHIGHLQSTDSPIARATAELEASMSKLREHCKTLVQYKKSITLITIDDSTFQHAIYDAKKGDIRASAENSAAVIASFLRQNKTNEELTQPWIQRTKKFVSKLYPFASFALRMTSFAADVSVVFCIVDHSQVAEFKPLTISANALTVIFEVSISHGVVDMF